ncbi:hypothetical protein Y032_0344g3083 [Ancylostoma ceylanicum]|uniref:Glycosyl hydrolase family 25 n=1 Tax=Ancylostoma ceylanicum TaxID=53326 RepID=A0A016RYC7_9BILA|nr:hypothetical protein Y032_0344g3083 [Ancylostoma ceylanicum]
MTPSLTSTKTGAQQFLEMYEGLRTNFNVRTIWLQVTAPVKWEPSISKNIQFIDSIIQAARANGLVVGIYTNAYDWRQITNEWIGANNTLLWYWNVFGSGAMAESPSDFKDYRAFGPWQSPSCKQFGQQESVCGQTLNRDIIVANPYAKPAAAPADDKIQIGGYI